MRSASLTACAARGPVVDSTTPPFFLDPHLVVDQEAGRGMWVVLTTLSQGRALST
jgi:hypothetical protein